MKDYRSIYTPGISLGDGPSAREYELRAEDDEKATAHLSERLQQMADDYDNSYNVRSLVEITQKEITRNVNLSSRMAFNSRRR